MNPSKRIFSLVCLVVLACLPVLPQELLGAGQDPVSQALSEWAANGAADETIIDGIFRNLDIRSKDLEDAFIQKVRAAGAGSARGEADFLAKVLDGLDRARYRKVQSALQQVLLVHDKGLEAVVRTGSSGLRHIELNGGTSSVSRYRPLFSDDDISFVGEKAIAASEMFNNILADQGLVRLKVKGFDLVHLRSVRQIDLIALDIMDPEKFLGEAGLGSIKGEMLEKGAVVAQKSGETMALTSAPLRSFVDSKKSRMLADLLDENGIKEAVRKYGALTMVASCERQITDAHGGWSNLTDTEKAKYVLRQRLALAESGALTSIAGMDEAGVQSQIQRLRELKEHSSFGAEDLDWLLSLRTDSFDLAFAELPRKLNPIIAAAEADGRSIAANPEVRKAINELMTALALIDSQRVPFSEMQVRAALRRTAGKNDALYQMLYTSYHQSSDLVQAVDEWVRMGGTRESFLEMLLKAKDGPARRELTAARRLKKASTPEGGFLEELDRVLGTSLGDNFVVKMITSPTGKRVLIGAMVVVGGRYALQTMYDSWARGTAREDLSDAAFGLIEFVPGGLGFKRAAIEGMDTQTAFAFVKDALYLTPAWPLVLAGDVIVMTVDMGQAVQTQTYQDGLVDVFVYNGNFDAEGKFTSLSLPDRTVDRSALKPFLFEAGPVAVKQAVQGLAFVTNISTAAHDVFGKYYLPNDPVMQQLRQAADTQLSEINKHEVWKALTEKVDPFDAGAAYLLWIAGYEGICKKSPEKWCGVFNLLKQKMEERKELVISNTMIPHLIQLAEEKHAKLSAPTELGAKLAQLQGDLEAIRTAKLEVDLAKEIGRRAGDEAARNAGGTTEEKALKAGEYWQGAYKSYQRILNISKTVKPTISQRTGYEHVEALQFKWTGDHADDLRKGEQSKLGFASGLSKILQDVRSAKGSAPDPGDGVDRQAFDILGQVVFSWRVVLDEADQAQAAEGAKYFDEYSEAVGRVKALYGRSSELQAQLDKGAQIVKSADTLVLGRSGGLEFRFTDAALKSDYDRGAMSIRWDAIPAGTFRPDAQSLNVTLAVARPEPVTVTVIVERSGVQKAKGSLRLTLPVAVPDDFLSLALRPASPKPKELIGAEASIPDRFTSGDYRFHYKWSASNCTVDDFDRNSTAVTAPATGDAVVAVELQVEGASGTRTTLIRREAKFTVVAPKPMKEGEKPPAAKPPVATPLPPGPPPAPSPTTPSGTLPKAVPLSPAGAKAPVATPLPLGAPPTPSPTTPPGAKPEPAKPPAEKPPAEKPLAEKPLVTAPGAAAQSSGSAAGGYWALTGVKDSRITSDQLPRPPMYSAEDCSVSISGTTVKTSAVITVSSLSEKDRSGSLASSGSWTELPKTIATAARVSTTLTSAGDTSELWTPGSTEIRGDVYFVDGNRSVKAGETRTFQWYFPEQEGKDVRRTVSLSHTGPGGDFTRTYTYALTPGAAPADALDVNIAADKPAPKLGDTVTLSAQVTGGIKPYTYAWTGAGSGTASALPFVVAKPGRHDFTVIVTDAKGAKTSAAASVEAKTFVATITITGGAALIPIGQTLSFQAQVSSPDGVAPPEGLVYRWQPNSAVTFAPTESTKNATTGKFPAVGKVKVWVDVLQRSGTVLSTVAESNQLEIDVVKPEISLRMFPAEPYPGQEVRITASESPTVGNAFITYWWEYAGNAINPGGIADPRVYTFRPKDTTPVTVTAHAKAKDGGDDLGAKTLVVTARPYTVQVTAPLARGPKPRVWSPQAKGLVEVEQQLAVFQDVSMRADVTPAPLSQPLRYQWTITPDGCSISNPISQEPTFNCSQTGGFSVNVSVRDSQGATLGTGTGSLSVSISQASLQSSKAQADAEQAKVGAGQKAADQAAQTQRDEAAKRDTAQRLRTEGQALQKQGKLREAIAKYRESLTYVPDPAMQAFIAQIEAAAVKQEQAATQATLGAEKKAADQAAQQATLAAEKKAADEAAQTQRDQQAKRATAQRLRTEGQALQKQGQLREAIARYRESLNYVPDPAMETFITQVEAAAVKQEQAAQQATLGAERKAADQAAQQAKLDAEKKAADQATQQATLAAEKKAADQAAQTQRDQQAKRDTAQRLRNEGTALQSQGKLREAAAKYRESLTYVPDPAMDTFIAQVEATAVKQEQAAQQATLAAEKKAADQAALQAKLAAEKKTADQVAQAKIATAQRLRDEGTALQQQGKLREAIAKYRESLPYYPDPALETIIAQVEAAALKQAQAAQQATLASEKKAADAAKREPAVDPTTPKWTPLTPTEQVTAPKPAPPKPAPSAPTTTTTPTPAAKPAPPAAPPAAAPAPAPKPASSPAPPGCSLTGEWLFRYEEKGETGTMTFSLRQTDTSLSGTVTMDGWGMSGATSGRGSVSGRDFRITFTSADGALPFSGTVSADCRSLTATMTIEGETQTMTFRRR